MPPAPILTENTLFYGDNLPILREYIADASVLLKSNTKRLKWVSPQVLLRHAVNAIAKLCELLVLSLVTRRCLGEAVPVITVGIQHHVEIGEVSISNRPRCGDGILRNIDKLKLIQQLVKNDFNARGPCVIVVRQSPDRATRVRTKAHALLHPTRRHRTLFSALFAHNDRPRLIQHLPSAPPGTEPRPFRQLRWGNAALLAAHLANDSGLLVFPLARLRTIPLLHCQAWAGYDRFTTADARKRRWPSLRDAHALRRAAAAPLRDDTWRKHHRRSAHFTDEFDAGCIVSWHVLDPPFNSYCNYNVNGERNQALGSGKRPIYHDSLFT